MSRMGWKCLSGPAVERPRTPMWVVLLVLLLGSAAGLFGSAAHAGSFGTDPLIRVEVKGPIQDLGVPVYAHLVDEAGNEYALTVAPARDLGRAGHLYQVIDDVASPEGYLLALERREGAREAAKGQFTILYDDGRRLIVKGGTKVADALAELGFDLKLLPSEPMVLTTPALPMPVEQAISYDGRVAEMIAKVEQTALYNSAGNITGEHAVVVGGKPYTIATRYTASGVPIQKATQYVYERLTALGLGASYQDWSLDSFTGRNVIGEKAGKSKPKEIVLVTCHLDSLPASGKAPGADDNGSGCVALITAAGIMKTYTFDRTVRFVFFTGEEQGLLGSMAYANKVSSASENVVAVYNMDMIAWNSAKTPNMRLHIRTSASPGYSADSAIAKTFTSVVSTYGLSSGLTPIITPDGEEASDHSSFWDKGYAGLLAIEDDSDDFNPYYHSSNDLLQRLNMVYFTNFTKASVGTAAHLAGLPTVAKVALTVSKAGTGKGAVTSVPDGINCGTTCRASFDYKASVVLTAVADDGSVFSGWLPAGICRGTGTCTVTMNSAKAVTAVFTGPQALTVRKVSVQKGAGTVTSDPDGINCGTTCKADFDYKASVVLTAVADDGSVFSGWLPAGICRGTGTCTVTMDKAKTISAVFTGPQTLTVRKVSVRKGAGTVTSDPEGIDCGDTCSAEFDYKTPVTLTAEADDGSTFVGWSPTSPTCRGTGTCTVTMDRAKAITARFRGE